MIHELLHIFLVTDNEVYWKTVREKYVHEEVVTQNHIILYSMSNQFYQYLWGNDPLDFRRDNLPLDYAKAVEIVKKVGYKRIIEEYRTWQ